LYSTTTFPNIVKKIEFQRIYPKLWIIFLYIMYLTTFDITNIIYFPAKNNCIIELDLIVFRNRSNFPTVLFIYNSVCYLFIWVIIKIHVLFPVHFLATDWRVWGGATYFLSWWLSRLRIISMWIYHCNVGKTKRLKKNMKEHIWYHQNMNRKKYV
jgi:hypothetical protein